MSNQQQRKEIEQFCRDFLKGNIVSDKIPELFDHPYIYTFEDIVTCLNWKLPLPIKRIYDLACKCFSYAELDSILFECVKEKTALSRKQCCKVAYFYFKDRYIFCT